MRTRSSTSWNAVPGSLLAFLTLSSVGAASALTAPHFVAVERLENFRNQGQRLAATLTLPEGAQAPYPIVLMLHGFTGQRQELPVVNTKETMFGRTARMLAEQGYASLRIDFRGSGESEGAWTDTTFTDQISDATAALVYIVHLKESDPRRIAVMGLSQGGLVASAVAAADRRVRTLVLWSPVANPLQTYGDLLGKETIAKGLASHGKAVTSKLPWGADTSLKSPFFRDLFNIDPIAEIARYPRPLLVVVGLKDTVLQQPQSGELYVRYHDGPEKLVELDADHVFDILTSGPGALDRAITASIEWLRATF